jgi:hypothetical protein
MEVSVSGSITSGAKIRKLYFIGMPLNRERIKLLRMFRFMNLQKNPGKICETDSLHIYLRNRLVSYFKIQ